MSELQKRCIKCLCVKDILSFYKNKAYPGGRQNKCAQCALEYATGQRLKHRDKIRARARATEARPDKKAEKRQRLAAWAAEFPERRKAQIALSNALQSGKVTRWPVCAVPDCSNTKPEAHHPDYSRPLDVVWLCKSHHKCAHLGS